MLFRSPQIRPPIIMTIDASKCGRFVLNSIIKKLMNSKTPWGNDIVEGVVIKNYNTQTFAKISRFDFSGEITKHHRRKPLKMNWLKSGEEK